MSDDAKAKAAGVRLTEALVEALTAAGVPQDRAIEAACDAVERVDQFLAFYTFLGAIGRIDELREKPRKDGES